MKWIKTLLVLLMASGYCHASEINFTVSMKQPQSHYLQLQMECHGLQGPSLDFKMPVWTPGYYKIMDHARHVFNLQAADSHGRSLHVHKISKNTWRVMARGVKDLVLTYEVYAFARSVADSYMDDSMAFLSPTGLFLYPSGQLNHPVTVHIKPTSDFRHISTGLDPVPDRPYYFRAPDFDILYDCPILVGNQSLISFDVQGITHTVAVKEDYDFDRDRLIEILTGIIRFAVAVVGDIPYKHYTFLFLGKGLGGLEHANSMAVYTDIPDLNKSEEYLRWLCFITHEYFHLYNVKSIRPITLGPFDYERENYTSLLWLSEGGTVYYQYLILNRAGFMSREKCLEAFQASIANYENSPGHRFQSASESSFDAWLYFLNNSGDAANTTISYYDKGAALCSLLDLIIRKETDGTKCLDDVMRKLYRVYYKQQQRGFTEGELREVCEDIAGQPLDEFFDVYVNGTGPIDYDKILAYAGLEISNDPESLSGIAWGVKTNRENGKLVISYIQRDSAAANAGLSIDDELIAWNSERLDTQVLKDKLNQSSVDDHIELLVARSGHMKKVILNPEHNKQISFEINVMDKMTDQQRALLDQWLIP